MIVYNVINYIRQDKTVLLRKVGTINDRHINRFVYLFMHKMPCVTSDRCKKKTLLLPVYAGFVLMR